MTLEQAIKMLETEYERAKKLKYVFNPLAYALYQVWKKSDSKVCRQFEEKKRSDNK